MPRNWRRRRVHCTPPAHRAVAGRAIWMQQQPAPPGCCDCSSVARGLGNPSQRCWLAHDTPVLIFQVMFHFTDVCQVWLQIRQALRFQRRLWPRGGDDGHECHAHLMLATMKRASQVGGSLCMLPVQLPCSELDGDVTRLWRLCLKPSESSLYLAACQLHPASGTAPLPAPARACRPPLSRASGAGWSTFRRQVRPPVSGLAGPGRGRGHGSCVTASPEMMSHAQCLPRAAETHSHQPGCQACTPSVPGSALGPEQTLPTLPLSPTAQQQMSQVVVNATCGWKEKVQ